MGFWKVILSRIAGRRPSVNQMDHQTIAKNIRTGSLLILREPVDGTKEVIEVTGGPPGTGESHLRAHQIDSADDHPPVAEEKRGKIVATNDATGAVELIGKDQVGAILDIYAADDPYFPIEHLMVQKPGVTPDTRVTTMLKPRGLLWGGMVSWLDGMWFGVSGAIYYIAGTMLFAPDIKLELDEADPDNPRIDVIVATSNSDFAVITGTPGVNPVKPYVDPVEHVEIAEITVPAGATGFGGSIFREVIYNENIEWTGTGVGLTVDFDSTTLPFFGSKCADAGAFGNNDYIKFVNGSPVTVADYDMMFLALKLKAAANATLTATFYLAGKAISSPAMVRFNASSLAWQQLYLILQEVKFKDTQFDEVRFTWLRIGAGTDPGFYLDYVRLERGISVPPQNTSVILTGDVTGNGVTGSPVQTTLKTVNEDVGQFGSATKVPKITVDAKGRVTAVEEVDVEGGGGGSPLISVTYAELITLITADDLIPGQQYLISDFATKHYFINFDNDDTYQWVTINTATNTGTTEPLIVTAVSVNKLHHEAKSTLYPEDRLYYDWNPANWLSDISFSYSGTIITGFKGVIYYRHDTIKNVELEYDFRNVKFRRWAFNLNTWNSGSTYNARDLVSLNGIAYMSLRSSNLNNNPEAGKIYWAPLNEEYSVDPYNYLFTSSSNYAGGGDPDDFADFYTFERYENVFDYHALTKQHPNKIYTGMDYLGIKTILTGVIWFMPWDESYIYNVRFTGRYEMSSIITSKITNIAINDFQNNIGNSIMLDISCKITFNGNFLCGSYINRINTIYFEGNLISHYFQESNVDSILGNIIAGSVFLRRGYRFHNNNVYHGITIQGFGLDEFNNCIIPVNLYGVEGSCWWQDFTGATQISVENQTHRLARTGYNTNVLIYYAGTTQYIVAANA